MVEFPIIKHNNESYDTIIDFPDGVLFSIDSNIKLCDEYNSAGKSKLHQMAKHVLKKYPNLVVPEGKEILAVLICPEYRRLNIRYSQERMFIVLGFWSETLEVIEEEYYCDMPVAKKTVIDNSDMYRYLVLKGNQWFEARNERYNKKYELLSMSNIDIWEGQKNKSKKMFFTTPKEFAFWVDGQVFELNKDFNRVFSAVRMHLIRLDFSRTYRQIKNDIERSKYAPIIWKIYRNEPFKDAIWDWIKPKEVQYFIPTLQKEKNGLRETKT